MPSVHVDSEVKTQGCCRLRKYTPHWLSSLFLCMIPAISYGASMTVTGLFLRCLNSPECSPYDYSLSTAEKGFFATSLVLAHIVMTLGCGSLVAFFGSRKVIIMSCFFGLVSWFGLGLHHHVMWGFLSRLGLGVSSGLGVTSSYTHLDEISVKASKGTLNIIFTMTLNLGSFGMLVGSLMLNPQPLSLIMCAFPLALLLLSFASLPEGPHFMTVKNKKESTFKSLVKLRTSRVAALEELVELESDINHDISLKVFARRFRDPEVFLPFIKMCTLMLLQVALGNDALTYFNVTLIERADIQAEHQGYVAMAQVVLNGAGYGLGAFLFTKMKRRAQLLIFGSCHGVAMLLVGLLLNFSTAIAKMLPPGVRFAIALFLLSLPMFFYGCSYGAVCFGMLSSAFPSDIKAMCCSIVLAIRYAAVLANMQILGQVLDGIAIGNLFFLFAGVTIFANLVVYFLPETSGLTLDQRKSMYTRFWSNLKLCSPPRYHAVHQNPISNHFRYSVEDADTCLDMEEEQLNASMEVDVQSYFEDPESGVVFGNGQFPSCTSSCLASNCSEKRPCKIALFRMAHHGVRLQTSSPELGFLPDVEEDRNSLNVAVAAAPASPGSAQTLGSDSGVFGDSEGDAPEGTMVAKATEDLTSSSAMPAGASASID